MRKEHIRSELEVVISDFHNLLDTITVENSGQVSKNPPWTNSELLFHMTFGYMVLRKLIPLVLFLSRLPKPVAKVFAGFLNATTPLFNKVNSWGARGGGKVFNYKRVRKLFDKTSAALLKRLERLFEEDLNRGIFYPTRWDSSFKEFMTIEELFHYTYIHFKSHKDQLFI